MDNRMFDAGGSLSDKESTGFEKAFIVFGDNCMPIGRPGKVMVEVTLDKDRETFAGIEFPRIREVSGQMVIDTMACMYEEEPRERKPLSRQESFGSYLRKGKKW